VGKPNSEAGEQRPRHSNLLSAEEYLGANLVQPKEPFDRGRRVSFYVLRPDAPNVIFSQP
jgi:hypothetical protein